MSFLLQATTKLDDIDQLREALDWLAAEVGHAPGLVSLRVFQAADDPARVTMLEEWESQDAFQQSFETYSLELRAEFLGKLGISSDDFERAFWLSTEINVEPRDR
jgi:quinol monooxygenase YgiN